MVRQKWEDIWADHFAPQQLPAGIWSPKDWPLLPVSLGKNLCPQMGEQNISLGSPSISSCILHQAQFGQAHKSGLSYPGTGLGSLTDVRDERNVRDVSVLHWLSLS